MHRDIYVQEHGIQRNDLRLQSSDGARRRKRCAAAL
jgi:hypothetical protein